jgi:hypothetical protein
MDDDKIVVTEAMRRAVYADECLHDGHLYDVIIEYSGEPVRLNCQRCELSWHVAGRADS